MNGGFVDEITNEAEDSKPVLTDTVASVIADAGIPMPPIEVKKGSFLERLVKAFSGQSNSQPAAEAFLPEAAQPSPKMSKVFTALAALLGSSPAVADGSVSLTEEQADKLEASVASHSTTVADLNAKISEKDSKIAELEAKVADLAKEPGADTGDVAQKPEPEIDPDKVATALLNMIP